MKKYIPEGGPIPSWYATAYLDWQRGRAVAYPIGIHKIVKWYKSLGWWLKRYDGNWLDEIDSKAWSRGYSAGRKAISLDTILTYLETHPNDVGRFFKSLARINEEADNGKEAEI